MSSEVRKPSALVSLTATYSDSDSDNDSDNNSNDNKSNNNDSNQSNGKQIIENKNISKINELTVNRIESRNNSPTNAFLSSIESLDKRRDSLNTSDNYNDDEYMDSRPNSPISYHKSLFGKSEDQIVIPSEPIDLCSHSLQDKIFKLNERMKMGFDMNTILQKRKDFRNPSIYEKLIAYCGIDEMATNYPQDIYDPHKWGSESYYEELAKRQKEDMEKRERDRKDKTKVEFISGTKKGHNENSNSNDSISKKKSKWDLPNVPSNTTTNSSQIHLMRPQIVIPVTVATGTKPTVISAFGTIGKKQK